MIGARLGEYGGYFTNSKPISATEMLAIADMGLGTVEILVVYYLLSETVFRHFFDHSVQQCNVAFSPTCVINKENCSRVPKSPFQCIRCTLQVLHRRITTCFDHLKTISTSSALIQETLSNRISRTFFSQSCATFTEAVLCTIPKISI